MKLTQFASIMTYLIFNFYGVSIQVTEILEKSNTGEVASIFEFNSFINSPLPLYLFQFLTVFAILSWGFISSQSYFSKYFSQITKNHIKSTQFAQLLWILIANFSLLILNSAYFQHSSHLTQLFNLWPENHPNIVILWAIIIAPILFYIYKNWQNLSIKIGAALSLIFIITFHSTHTYQLITKTTPEKDKPNIIIIGIDSLRSDLLRSHMPFLHNKLNESVTFDTALTPLGRTFPAWNTILTGLHPVNHGAQINLIPPSSLIDSSKYIPHQLKKEGYRSIFAIDETRFANIGSHQGFDQVISPRMGASDFLISSIADIPLVNLLSLASISEWLLPEIYANRGAAKTYRSKSFSTLLNNNLPIADKPTFLSVHFCLAHWPYIFSTPMKPDYGYYEPYYPINLIAVDEQIKALFETLKRKGYLENSRILFISDHGEAWPPESMPFVNINDENDIYNLKEYGHGSSLTSYSNHVLLGFHNFKAEEQLYKNKHKVASLADITPTILSELKISTGSKFDGRDLTSPSLPENTIIPVESGTILQVDDSNKLNIKDIVDTFLNRYELNSNGLLSIKASKIKEGLNAKAYGLRNGNLILHFFEDGSFKLFDQNMYSFTYFKDFNALKKQKPRWTRALCDYYPQKYNECL